MLKAGSWVSPDRTRYRSLTDTQLRIVRTLVRPGAEENPFPERLQLRNQFRRSQEQRLLLSRLVEWDIQDFDCNTQAGQLDFSIVHAEGQIRMRFSLSSMPPTSLPLKG